MTKSTKTENANQNAGQQKIKVTKIELTAKVKSPVLAEFLEDRVGLIINVYGRIGGLLRMVSDNKRISDMVRDWNEVNLEVMNGQIEDLENQVEVARIEADVEEGSVVIDRPEPVVTHWTVNHPIFNKVTKVIGRIDEVICRAEEFYFLGAVDDHQYRTIQLQAMKVITGSLDRVRKATSPGKRETDKGTRYISADLSNHIQQGGYRLEFFDLPEAFRKLTEEYDKRHAAMKSLKEQRERQQQKQGVKSDKDEQSKVA